ncbi:M20/M25/M40 family metallo-hydrolase [Aliikangiella sp. IMCC44359]|uniref:M20/M25/M40 family metallo-hydrolase n=1 Tax=Aliikangiella sp. IMCC44359 TaxID=3459125 RepID=UPI00403AC234
MLSLRKIKHAIILTICCFSITNITSANNISLEELTEDVSYLASDELKGRGTYTQEIDQAANYIAKRFSSMGLEPLAGENSFKQSFNIYQISPDSYQLSLNGKNISSQDIMLLTSYKELNWTKQSKVKIQPILKEDDFRKKMREVNSQGVDTLVVVDRVHSEIFNRYRQHFMKGLTKFKPNVGPSAVVALTDNLKITQFKSKMSSKVISQRLTNVIGVLPGKKLKQENVLFSAHYDHIGNNPKLEKDTIYNGADDDASGTAAVINIANYFSKKKNNQRTLVFAAFTAEEIGGYGSKYFSKKIDPNKVIAMLNIEMIGKPSRFGSGQLWMTGYERSDLANILNKNLTNAKIHPDPYPEQKLFYRSDNATLARLGVPAHSFSSSQIDKDQHYHKPSDDIKSLDLKSMTQVVQTLVEASETLVNGTDTPSRLDTTKIKGQGKIF